MSALKLTVESVDEAAKEGVDSNPKKGRHNAPVTWIRSIFGQEKQLPRNVWLDKTNYTEAEVANVLRDFLQPNTKKSSKMVTEHIISMVPPNASGNAEVRSFGEICVELAEQIPYNHLSQLKLTALFQRLGKSPKFISTYPLTVTTSS